VARRCAESATAEPYVQPRLLFLRFLLDLEARSTSVERLGQLKRALRDGSAQQDWDIRPALERLKPQLTAADYDLIDARGLEWPRADRAVGRF
jgi:hypothetical protein